MSVYLLDHKRIKDKDVKYRRREKVVVSVPPAGVFPANQPTVTPQNVTDHGIKYIIQLSGVASLP